MKVLNAIMKRYVSLKDLHIGMTRSSPYQSQKRWLKKILNQGETCQYATKYGLSRQDNRDEFAKKAPLVYYEDISCHIKKMMRGHSDVLWPGKIKWFSKSSGTTDNSSKYIPVTENALYCNHINGFTNAIGLLYQQIPHSPIFTGKSMTLGGEITRIEGDSDILVGDISAIVLNNMPRVGKYFYALPEKITKLDNWEEKISEAADILSKTDTITMIGGVPTWNIVLFNRILKITGKSNMLEVWPNAQIYMHGGIGFNPYKKTFQKYFPKEDFIYQEIYNASEGFFAVQDLLWADDMLLLLDHGIYFEFVPKGDTLSEKKAIVLEEVEVNKEYAIVITNNSGLWRYMPGDLIRFTNLKPYRIQIVGRVKQFINAFGEEVIIDNVEKAISAACSKCHCEVVDYTVAPVYITGNNRGYHQWAIEFKQAPLNIDQFIHELDDTLQAINSDYKAKRYRSLAMTMPKVEILPEGTFFRWLKMKNRMRAQSKVPRLNNHRTMMEELLAFTDSKVAI